MWSGTRQTVSVSSATKCATHCRAHGPDARSGQAIGLSDSQLVKMLQMEGLFYTFGSLGIILTLGNVIGYIAFLIFKNSGASYATYHYPLVQTIIMIVAVTVAQILITYLIASNFRKESLVDRVRYSE